MSEQTKISWCDSTVNFWSGCTKVSAGCAHCYAETLSKCQMTNLQGISTLGKWGPGAPRKLHESAFKLAHRLNRKPWVCDCGTVSYQIHHDGMVACPKCLAGYHRRQIFSLSLGDIWDPEVPVETLARVLDTMRQCNQVTWLLLSKRPELWHERIERCKELAATQLPGGDSIYRWLFDWQRGNHPAHIKLCVSVEDQESADKRIQALLRITASGLFVSFEPLLGPVDLDSPAIRDAAAMRGDKLADVLGWAIIGGESGPHARPCNVEWIRSLKDQCQAAGVPCFVKQVGSNPCSDRIIAMDYQWLQNVHDPKGGNPSEWPEYLRVREWPKWRAS
jgi:protein gp37